MIGAIGMVETKNIVQGVSALDWALKKSNIKILKAKVVCPGKFIFVVKGSSSDVKEAVDEAISRDHTAVLDSTIIGSPSDDLIKSLNYGGPFKHINSLGVIETYTICSALYGADRLIKASAVSIVDFRLGFSLGGRGLLIFTGSESAVKDGINAVSKEIGTQGLLCDKIVLERPDPEFISTIVSCL